MLKRTLSREITFTIGTLALTSALCAAMLVVRALVFRDFGYWFLGWNLLLAWVPLLAAALATPLLARRGRAAIAFALPVLMVWLFFLPNAPYLVTDIFHWRQQASWQGWFELLMFVTFAWTGCMLGFASLRLVHQAVRARYGAWPGWLLVAGTSIATGFGVYLGRFLRFNSWDLATGAIDDIALTVLGMLWNPTRNAMPLAFALTITAFFLLGYLCLMITDPRGSFSPAACRSATDPARPEPPAR